MLTFCVLLIISQVIFAFAGVAGSPALLITSRALSGLVSGPQCLTSYVAKSTQPARRTAVMLRVGITIAGGYASGVLLGGLLAQFPSYEDRIGHISATTSGESLVGWLVALFAVIELGLLVVYFEEPPEPRCRRRQVKS